MLADRKVRQVTSGIDADAIRPLLSAGRAFCLCAADAARDFSCDPRGSWSPGAEQLRAGEPKTAIPLTLYANASAVPAMCSPTDAFCLSPVFRWATVRTPELFLVYSDGSGVESYRCDHPALPHAWGGKQLASGDVVFTHGSSLARFTSPLAHEEHVPMPRGEYAGAISETASGGWLVSARDVAHARTFP